MRGLVCHYPLFYIINKTDPDIHMCKRSPEAAACSRSLWFVYRDRQSKNPKTAVFDQKVHFSLFWIEGMTMNILSILLGRLRPANLLSELYETPSVVVLSLYSSMKTGCLESDFSRRRATTRDRFLSRVHVESRRKHTKGNRFVAMSCFLYRCRVFREKWKIEFSRNSLRFDCFEAGRCVWCPAIHKIILFSFLFPFFLFPFFLLFFFSFFFSRCQPQIWKIYPLRSKFGVCAERRLLMVRFY